MPYLFQHILTKNVSKQKLLSVNTYEKKQKNKKEVYFSVRTRLTNDFEQLLHFPTSRAKKSFIKLSRFAETSRKIHSRNYYSTISWF